MADKYVTPTGAGLKDGSDIDNAYDSVQDGITNVGTGDTVFLSTGTFANDATLTLAAASMDNKAVTVQGVAGTLIETTSTFGAVSVTGAIASASIEFIDCEFTNSAAAGAFFTRWDSGIQALDLVYTNCTVTPVVANTWITLFFSAAEAGTGSTRTLTCTGCELNSKGSPTFEFSKLEDFGDVLFDTCVIDYPGTGTGDHLFNPKGARTKFEFINNTVTMATTGGGSYFIPSSMTAMDLVIFKGNTITGGGFNAGVGGSGIKLSGMSGDTYKAFIIDNEINCYGRALSIGADSAETILDLGYIYVEGNTFTKVGTGEGHVVFVGLGDASNLDILNNKFDSSSRTDEYALVIKSTGCTAKNNICIGDYAADIKGGQGVTFENNTCVTTKNYALWIEDQPAAAPNPQRFPFDFVIKNNIFDGTGGLHAIKADDETHYTGDLFDYNCIYGGSTATTEIDGNKTFEQWRAYWAANGSNSLSVENSLNGLNVDPQLDAEYKPQNPAVKTGGKPDITDDDTSMGAIGATATAGGYRSRYSG